jgi:hypothetical protein
MMGRMKIAKRAVSGRFLAGRLCSTVPFAITMLLSTKETMSIDKNQQSELDYGIRKLTTYPDTPEAISLFLLKAGLLIEKQFETEFAHVFAAKKG